jgi:hypothetical protein
MALTIADATGADIEAIVALWQRCELTRPWNDPRADIAPPCWPGATKAKSSPQ